MIKIIIRSLFLLVALAVQSQNILPAGTGEFDSSYTGPWWTSDDGGVAIFSQSSVDYYHGGGALKVELTSNSSLARMHTRAAQYFQVNSGQDYTISFYAKGSKGNELQVALMDGNGNIEIASNTETIRLTEWTYYSFTVNSNTTTSSGRIRVNFLNEGIYYLDELHVKEGAFQTWYVSPSGANNLNGVNGQSLGQPLQTVNYAINNAWHPGDIIYVMDGTYRNSNYGSGLNNGSVVAINKAGELNGPLIIRNAPGHSPKIEFDGAGGFVAGTAIYLEISGFEIQGPVADITVAEAEANRFSTNNYYRGRGIAIWAGSGGHHIILHSNKVYDCPNSGIRINNSDYCTLAYNEVYNCTGRSSSAESALVLAQSKSYDSQNQVKMRIVNNLVYNNVNTIHYYNSSYTCTDTTAYGCADFPNIIDGSGCYITRNNDRGSGQPDENPNGQYTGYFYFANNISYGNGINGLVVHKSDNAIVVNNTNYMNGAVPLSEGRQDTSGIVVNNSTDVRVYNNISWTRFSTDYGYKVFGATSRIWGTHNILVNGMMGAGGITGTLEVDPLFVNAAAFDFELTASSPAIDAGKASGFSKLTNTVDEQYLPRIDFFGNDRSLTTPDIGAVEYNASLNIPDYNFNETLQIYPNPSSDYIIIGSSTTVDVVKIYDVLGNLVITSNQSDRVDVSMLKSGGYFVIGTSSKTKLTAQFLKK